MNMKKNLDAKQSRPLSKMKMKKIQNKSSKQICISNLIKTKVNRVKVFK